jgi:hypothetical protein
MARRWYQFSLKSLMAIVVVICLTLGGWQMLMTFGQWVEAEPAVVGQPIQVSGRFFHFGEKKTEYGCPYDLVLKRSSVSGSGESRKACGWRTGWRRYNFRMKLRPVDEPGEYTLTLTPSGCRPIHGKFAVRPAE